MIIKKSFKKSEREEWEAPLPTQEQREENNKRWEEKRQAESLWEEYLPNLQGMVSSHSLLKGRRIYNWGMFIAELPADAAIEKWDVEKIQEFIVSLDYNV